MKKGSLGQNNEVLTDVRKNDFGKNEKKWNFVKKSHKCLTKNHIIIDKKILLKWLIGWVGDEMVYFHRKGKLPVKLSLSTLIKNNKKPKYKSF